MRRQSYSSNLSNQEWAILELFTALPENVAEIEPRQLFLDPVWYMPSDDENPVSLLGE